MLHLFERVHVPDVVLLRNCCTYRCKCLAIILWYTPWCARFSVAQNDASPLVWAMPLTYSPTLCLTVSCSLPIMPL